MGGKNGILKAGGQIKMGWLLEKQETGEMALGDFQGRKREVRKLDAPCKLLWSPACIAQS